MFRLAAAVMVAAGFAAVRDQAPAAAEPGVPMSGPIRAALEQILSTDLGFLPGDLDAVRAGAVVTRSLETSEAREVPIAGAMHTTVAADYFVGRLANVGVPSAGAAAPDAGRFSQPAIAADLTGWSLAAADTKTLDLCDIHGCGMRLADQDLAKLRLEAGPRASLAAAAWSAGARQAVAGYVTDYQTYGVKALPAFRSGGALIRPSDDVPILRSRFRFLTEGFPDLARFLDAYPSATGQVATNQLYWSSDVVMATPILSVSHLVMWRALGSAADIVIVNQQIYTSREVDGLVEVTLVAADTTPDKPGCIVVSTSRTFASGLQGLMGAAKRPVVRGKARTALRDYLTRVRASFEHDDKRTP